MISTAEIVEELVASSSFLEEGLQKGIISYSALARNLTSQVEKKLMKKVSKSAIVMALRRIRVKLIKKAQIVFPVLNLSEITVRSNLVELTYLNSDSITEKHKQVFTLAEKNKEIFCNLSQGVRETMFIIGKEITQEVEQMLKNEILVTKITDLSSITIHLPKETIDIPGVYYSILKLLAWNDINIIDVVSTYSELTIIVRDKNIDKAFSVLKNF